MRMSSKRPSNSPVPDFIIVRFVAVPEKGSVVLVSDVSNTPSIYIVFMLPS